MYFIDFDRTGSSPPKQSSQLTITTPYTPGNGQKRFNPFMKDSSMSNPFKDHINSRLENIPDKAISKDTIAQQHNDENKNIILVDDDKNQNILSTSVTEKSDPTLFQTQLKTIQTHFDDDIVTKMANNDSDSSEMSSSLTEAPLPDWIALNESVLIRPYNTSGVISFIGSTHFSVIFHLLLLLHSMYYQIVFTFLFVKL